MRKQSARVKTAQPNAYRTDDVTQNYTDVFGNTTVPPAQYGYSSLTTTVDVEVVWVFNYSGLLPVLTDILEVSCSAGDILTFPDATQVSNGQSALIRNIGANALIVHSNSGVTLASIPAGVAQYFYVTDNSTAGGAWGQVTYGAGSAAVNAGALAGLGLKAIGATLNVATPVFASAGNYTVTATDRAELIEFTAGAATLTLPTVASAGNDFLFYVKNSGSGAVAIAPQSGEMIDNQSAMALQPNESAIIVCSGTAWFTVGYGRSTLYQFSQLVLDVSAGGTFTLNATQASNKLLTFVGNPAGSVTVVVPNVVAIYYIQSNISTAQNITVKTAAGTGVVVPQSQRTIGIDDGTNVSGAVTVTSTTNLSLVDGTVSSPSLSFASQTNTGIYKLGATGFGISVAGVAALNLAPGAAEIPGTLKVDGVLTAAAGINVTGNSSITGNEAVSGTFNVTGATTTAGITNVGALNTTGTATVTGDEAISGTLNVTGTTTLATLNTTGTTNHVGALNVTGNAAISGTLNVTGLSTLAATTVGGALNVSGTGIVVGAGAGTPVTYVAPGTPGNVLANVAGVWTSAPPNAPVLSVITASLGADVALNNAGLYFDGPSVAQGTSGTWFVSGTVTLQDGGNNNIFNIKLWDGTTLISSARVQTTTSGFTTAVALSGFLATPSGNFRISVQDTNSTTGLIKFNATGNSKDSTITAIRVA